MGSNSTFTALVAEFLLYSNTLSTMGTKGGGGRKWECFFVKKLSLVVTHPVFVNRAHHNLVVTKYGRKTKRKGKRPNHKKSNPRKNP